MTIPIPENAVRSYLRATAAVTALVPVDQIYAGELPGTEVTAQPRTAVQVTASGGPPDRGHALIGRTRIDVRAYGRTPLEALQVSNAVHEALKALSRVRVSTGLALATLLHGITAETGPSPLRDAEMSNAPLVLRVYQVMAAEIAA